MPRPLPRPAVYHNRRLFAAASRVCSERGPDCLLLVIGRVSRSEARCAPNVRSPEIEQRDKQKAKEPAVSIDCFDRWATPTIKMEQPGADPSYTPADRQRVTW